jgi:hypothetical protein
VRQIAQIRLGAPKCRPVYAELLSMPDSWMMPIQVLHGQEGHDQSGSGQPSAPGAASRSHSEGVLQESGDKASRPPTTTPWGSRPTRAAVPRVPSRISTACISFPVIGDPDPPNCIAPDAEPAAPDRLSRCVLAVGPNRG